MVDNALTTGVPPDADLVSTPFFGSSRMQGILCASRKLQMSPRWGSLAQHCTSDVSCLSARSETVFSTIGVIREYGRDVRGILSTLREHLVDNTDDVAAKSRFPGFGWRF